MQDDRDDKDKNIFVCNSYVWNLAGVSYLVFIDSDNYVFAFLLVWLK